MKELKKTNVGYTRRRTRPIRTSNSQVVPFAVCLNNKDYPASLELGKLYRIVPDKQAAADGLMRVIDESGEDYAYAADRFHPMKVPSQIQRALIRASKQAERKPGLNV
jgi:hypothetical protein